LGVADEDYVGINVAANEGQFAAVGRPSKAISDVFGLEVCKLFSGRAVKRLEPEVIDVTVAGGVDDCFAVGTEADGSRRRALAVPWR